MGMREEFEAAACAICLRDVPDCGLTVEEIAASRRGDEYETSMWSFAWWAWQESRAALVVELPKITEFSASDSVGYVLDRCDDMITAQGWVVK